MGMPDEVRAKTEEIFDKIMTNNFSQINVRH